MNTRKSRCILVVTVITLFFLIGCGQQQSPSGQTPKSDEAASHASFMVEDGAFPWHDRVNTWALANVPGGLKGNGPLPQQSCDSRALDVPVKCRSITLGVAEVDLEKFKKEFPAVMETGLSIAVRNPEGTVLSYHVLTFPDPPQKIVGADVLSAGLLLLKIDK
jgi:hypothetical protein